MKAVRQGIAALAVVLSSGVAQAALIDRGGGMLYDDVLNITWLQDANYARTSGYDADGKMSWSEAKTWADNLNFGGYHDWRLASTTDTGSLGCNFSYGGTDCGHSSTGSELAHMYYDNLKLKAYYSISGAYQANFGIFGNGTTNGVNTDSYGQNDLGLVDNLQSYTYWSGTAYALDSDNAWYFGTYAGYQHYGDQDIRFHAWAVRSGDLAVTQMVNDVPEPSSVLLFGLALAGLGAARRRGRFGT